MTGKISDITARRLVKACKKRLPRHGYEIAVTVGTSLHWLVRRAFIPSLDNPKWENKRGWYWRIAPVDHKEYQLDAMSYDKYCSTI
jgi:hypothetical protein